MTISNRQLRERSKRSYLMSRKAALTIGNVMTQNAPDHLIISPDSLWQAISSFQQYLNAGYYLLYTIENKRAKYYHADKRFLNKSH